MEHLPSQFLPELQPVGGGAFELCNHQFWQPGVLIFFLVSYLSFCSSLLSLTSFHRQISSFFVFRLALLLPSLRLLNSLIANSMSLMVFSNSPTHSSICALHSKMPYIFFIFFGFKHIFLNGYLEVVNFIDFSITVTDCSIVILRIHGFALIVLVSCSVVLVMMLGLS